MKTRRVSGGGCLFLLVALSCAGADLADDRQYLAQLVAGGKLDQAELICREKLAQDALGVTDRAAYTCELLRVVTERARRRNMREEDLWAAAEKIAADYLLHHAESPSAVLVQLQAALVELARAEQLLGAASADALTKLRQLARNVGRRLKKLGSDVDERMRRNPADPNLDGYLNRKQLRGIRAAIRQQRARALMLLADSFTDSVDDRLLSTAEAKTELEKISPGDLSPGAWWRSRIAMIGCHRRREEWDAAARLIEELQAAPSAAELGPLIEAEQLRVALDRKLWSTVRSSLAVAPTQLVPELALTRFEALLALAAEAQRVGNAELSRTFQSRAADSLPTIESDFGLFWRRRAEQFLWQNHPSTNQPSALVAAVGRNLFRQGQSEAAAERLLVAADLAAASGSPSAARNLGQEAAAIARQAKLWQLAEKCYLRVCNDWSDSPTTAAQAHLSAIQCAAQLAKTTSAIQPYQLLLDEHLQRWPDAATVGPATWRARLAERDGDWLTAAKFHLVALRNSHVAQVGADLQRCLWQACTAGLRVHDFIADAVESLITAVDTDPDLTPQLLLAADLHLLPLPGVGEGASSSAAGQGGQARALNIQRSHQRAQLQERLQAAAPANRPEFYPFAARLISIQAANQDWTAAMNLIDQWPAPLDSALVLNTLEQLASHVIIQPQGARLQLALIDRYLASGGKFEVQKDQFRLDMLRARAHLHVGQIEPAIRLSRTCAKDAADGETQALLAECLSRSERKSELQEALRLWQRIEQRTEPESAGWFTAKLRMAEVLLRLGETARAANAIRLLSTLHPSLGGPELKRQFSLLLQECERAFPAVP